VASALFFFQDLETGAREFEFSYVELLDLVPLKLRTLFTLCGSPDSLIILERQGMLKMKKPQVISPHAQNKIGLMRYMLSGSFANLIVWDKRKQAATEALWLS
jgi:hypothetical protein